MDEPQVTNQAEEIDPSTDKNDLNEDLSSGFENEEVEKSLNADDVLMGEEPSTSVNVTMSEKVSETIEPVENLQIEATDEHAGEVQEVSTASDQLEQSVEQVIFEKPIDEHDETVQSEIETDNLEFTEHSINISQLNVEHNDDSNDAFNALKESEIDALQTPKEEVDEPKVDDSEPISDPQQGETIDVESESTDVSLVGIQTIETMDIEKTTNLEEKTDDNTSVNDVNTDITQEVGTETADFDENESIQTEDAADKPDNEYIEDIPDDDGTTETTNEGEGVDENVCLLGDETELGENYADKEITEMTEEATDENTSESATVDKEAVIEENPSDDLDDTVITETEETDQMEVDGDEEIADQEPLTLKENEICEISGEITEKSCLNCENTTKCLYQVLEESGEIKHLCTFNCVKEHREDNSDKYTLVQKTVNIQEIPLSENLCSKCSETKLCKYRYRIAVATTVTKPAIAQVEGETTISDPAEPTVETVQSRETRFLCDDSCLKELIGENTDKYIVKEVKRRSARKLEVPKSIETEEEQEVPKIVARSDADVETARIDRDQSFMRRCVQCFEIVNFTSKSIQWETMDFCDEKCLGLRQNLIGAACSQCNEVVSLASIGKLCVRFGPELKQFCTTNCLNEFKKSCQICMLCFKDLKKDDENEATVSKSGNNFCDKKCATRYDEIIHPNKKRPPYLCSVCNNKQSPMVEVLLDGDIHRFCSSPCFSAFKFVNNVNPDQCDMCTRHFERKSNDAHTIFQGNASKIFCSKICQSIFITKSREVWQCNWCKVSKYSYDMVQLNYGKSRMCSLNCLSLFEVSVNALARKRTNCDHCKLQKQPMYHLTMSDASIRNFCTYQCVLGFQSTYSKARITGETPSIVPAGTAKRIKPASANFDKQPVPVISLVQSLNTRRGVRQPYNPVSNRRSGSPIPVPELTVSLERLSDLPARVKVSSLSSLTGNSSNWIPMSTSPEASPVRVEHKTQVVTIPPLPKQVGNKSTMCKAITLNKAINCVPATAEAECQTEDWLEQRIIVPVPIIVYVPQPMMMYSLPTPVAVPFVLPVPVPVFVPTTRNSASGIMKEIKKIQEKMPTDPYEAELLMMAEMVAGDKKREETDSESDENNEIEYSEAIENNASFNEDLVQMAFKMASNDFDDPPVDLENEMTANTISQTSNAYGDDLDSHSLQHHQLLLLQQQRDTAAAMQSNRGRKRIQQPIKPTNNRNSAPNKRIKREMEVMQPEMPREPAEKPDANMCLKYTFGVNAWKQWVATKNADFEKSSIRRKPIKSEILQLTADELNYSLCMFVKEVRKPNGSEYAPDTIYYLVLGIQQYLYENGRIDNIFTDRYYEQFTDCLDEVAKKFSVLYNDSQYIVTRVEEEHLWECKQLGAHSPHVLLSTLMFFNTKHFNLVTVDEHMELSFSHIMKHWKRNPNQPGAAKVPGSRNVLLRFYPPQSSLEANSRKKKVYEQQENEENPLRCPVKLYEFYLSKCPESVKTRNDVFYLQPERSCVPDSPVWYSTQPLSRDALSKMLHRVKMVKEINIALLTS